MDSPKHTQQQVLGFPVDATHSIVYEPVLQRAQRIVTIKASRIINICLGGAAPYEVKMQITVYSSPLKTAAECDNFVCSKLMELHSDYKGIMVNNINITIKD